MTIVQPSSGQSSPTAYQPLQRNKGVFRSFEQAKYTEPEQVKSATDFFVREITENQPIKSYLKGFERYTHEVTSTPWQLFKTTGLIAGLTLLQTMFRKQRARVESVFLLAFLWYPVSAAVNTIPKMINSYKLARAGEPTEAKTQFRQSFNEFVFQVFHNYIKPFTISTFIAYPLLNPKAIPQALGRLSEKWLPKQFIKLAKRFSKNPTQTEQALLKPLKRFEAKVNHFASTNKVLNSWDQPAQKLENLGIRLRQWWEKLW